MAEIRTKADLYRAAARIRTELALPPEGCRADEVFRRIAHRPESILTLVPFATPGLQGMASVGQDGERDVILLAQRLDERERGFYAAHELVHLTCHRQEQGGLFRCFDSYLPARDDYLEWQANEGAAEILMPWRLFLQTVLDLSPDLTRRSSIQRLQLELADRFGVTQGMIAVRLESLKYELHLALQGEPIDGICPISAREQQRRNIAVPSLNDLSRQLWQQELDYHRRLREIDV